MTQFRNEKWQIIEQQVNYDWKPSLCDLCHKCGHATTEYKKNKAKEPNVIATDVQEKDGAHNTKVQKGKQVTLNNKVEYRVGIEKPNNVRNEQNIPISNSFQQVGEGTIQQETQTTKTSERGKGTSTRGNG